MELLILRIINKFIRITKKLLISNPLSKWIRKYDYELHFSSACESNLFRGVFGSIQEALESAPSSKPIGYNHTGPANMYMERTKVIYASDYPVLFWLQRILKNNSKLFDLGGHIGVGYYAYSKFIKFPENLQWLVCEVPEVARLGKQLANKNDAINLSFTCDYSEIEGNNILFASGSIQYIERSLADMLDSVDNKPEHVIVNLLPIHESKSFVTLQNIGTAFCPYQIFNQFDFLSDMSTAGYICIDSWKNEEKSCIIPFYPEYSLDHYTGIYFRLNNL